MTDATLQECLDSYTQFREYAARAQRRWRWIAAISGTAGLGLGALLTVALRPRRETSDDERTR
ncbi:hypothetical protein OV090_12625 [Nannocystis sp. RBIL2]|uniref:hypothetical protein n=1 Tax=Nannocystis sp. RBIL2 TaxID=2996788 RepID=UPI002271D52D|nr:hypothetical protein [Nannocystis sp. RBIL2]MCY1065617.1 hypothetical protein [Nannocystis sp. RBIL2]